MYLYPYLFYHTYYVYVYFYFNIVTAPLSTSLCGHSALSIYINKKITLISVSLSAFIPAPITLKVYRALGLYDIHRGDKKLAAK